ncbi:ABC transporter substrate-binding protein [Mucilaginibacter psychrotolerans]|uniref:Amino acid ABC transporter substrate-binding protein n=1 Tax=Mucilaginibacter psychrotolerans TaxID=1524096 RepID=A0A4Y8S9E7_9SPHI|nr:ABC transporter substrate-binding protein [Mucilaginibacter psychrotolerans]TFF35064.1 amino acid ABC transporter substrate-binding protein [Mucilaginibacter psychrotolerans]
MTSVRNHRPLLSGNKWFILVLALVVGACSPKVRTVPVAAKPVPTAPVAKPEKPIPPPVKPPEPKFSVVSLILPLGLDKLVPGQSYSAAALSKANMSAEYYQGFKLALDSVAGQGANFKLQVFDSKDDAAIHSLAQNPQVKNGDLIVGPIFPEDIRIFASMFNYSRKPIVSPLSPASPTLFNNQNIVTMTPPLEYHAKGAATYTVNKLRPKKVFILNSGFSDEKLYTAPFKRTIDSLSKRKIQVVPFTVVRGNLTPLVAQLNNKVENVFLVPSTKQAFLMVTLKSLDTLSRKFPVTLFGHPNWEKFAFLKANLLQRLKTHITSTDNIDYKSPEVNTFIRIYRRAYHTDPTDFAIKGFDEGLYFAQLMAREDDSYRRVEQNDFIGLHNSFHFEKKPGLGWVNTHVDILRYQDFELKPVQ